MPRHRLALSYAVCCALAVLLSSGAASADEAADLRTLIARGDLPAALLQAQRAVAAQPRQAPLRFLLGVILMDMKRDAEALALFNEIALEYPELPDPYNNIAVLQARAGALEAARGALEAALRNDPGHRAARLNLGQVHLMLAVQAWQRADADRKLDAPLQHRLEAARALLSAEPTLGPHPAPPAR